MSLTMSMINPKGYFESYFKIDLYRAEASALIDYWGIPHTPAYYALYNQIEHAYTSGRLQMEWGDRAPNMSQALGNSLEISQMYPEWFSNFPNGVPAGPNADSWRDLWNNAMGRQIGEYARQNNLSRGDFEDLIKQAYDRGDFKTPSDAPPGASGWPGQFPLPGTPGAPVWGGPDSGWSPSGGDGFIIPYFSPIDPPPPPDSPFSPSHPSPLQKHDPLVVDLGGNGIQLTNVQDSSAHFDYGGTGFAPQTGWVSATDGILVHDIPVDGSISGAQLFGATSGNGFTDLAAFDSNNDGKVDASDTNYSHLRIWQDLDGDGVADSGELISLAAVDIVAINLNRQASGESVEGNLIVEIATVVHANNSTSVIAEVNFATDALNSQYTPPSGFTPSESALTLPMLVGYGNVPDIYFVMSDNPDLEDAVRDFVLGANSMTGTQFDADFEALSSLKRSTRVLFNKRAMRS